MTNFRRFYDNPFLNIILLTVCSAASPGLSRLSLDVDGHDIRNEQCHRLEFSAINMF